MKVKETDRVGVCVSEGLRLRVDNKNVAHDAFLAFSVEENLRSCTVVYNVDKMGTEPEVGKIKGKTKKNSPTQKANREQHRMSQWKLLTSHARNVSNERTNDARAKRSCSS